MSQASGDHTHAVATHYNQLEEIGLKERTRSRIFYLRNFNNWTKSIVIADTLAKLREQDQHRSITVLDLCSGKGGDLLKWKKGRINSVVCADIAATSVKQSAERYRNNIVRERFTPFQAEFLEADCTKECLKDKYENPNQKFDLTSCQFSFHYSFESYPQAMMMIRNACECLRIGGYFIGTTPDSNELVRRVRSSPDNSFGNDVYRITFEQTDKTTYPLFGAKYNFHLTDVVDCPEFLVHFPALEHLAEQYGMKLIEKVRFDDFFRKHSQNRDNQMLLANMQSLEPFPPLEGFELSSDNPEEYKLAREFQATLDESQLEERTRRNMRIGTLSQSEWEAATLYLVFVFQKVKDVSPQYNTSASATTSSQSPSPSTTEQTSSQPT